MQFPFLSVGLKWKVVKNVHCPLLLIDTGLTLMSIGPLTKKLLQKHRPVSYSQKRRKRALSPRSLTESSAENVHFPHGPLLKALQRANSLETACAG